MNLRFRRLISQVVFFFSANLGFKIEGIFPGLKTGFCYPFFYCHACPSATAACPLRAIEIGVYEGKWNWKLIFYPILIISFVGVISGRGVCGWACPIGLLQRVTGKVAKKLKKKQPFLKKLGQHRLEPYLRYLKYIVFIGLVVVTPILVGFMFTDICPVGYLVGTIPISILNPGEFSPNEFFYIALVIFILFIVLIFTVERGWCRYLCPIGAMLAPFNKVSKYQVSVDKDQCIHCNICSNEACPMGIDVPNMERDPECILCGKCIEACPKDVIKFEGR
ncbi:MAG: 4Fe-4S binding protein [Thermoplasmatales archaeon]|nr:MAG: 4Fe-4S binding protein [Thermoplasmatales archaeon]